MPQGYTSGLEALGSWLPGFFSTVFAHTSLYCSAVSIFGRLVTFSKPSETFTSTRSLPLWAFFVVMRMTPLEPTDAP